MILCSYCSITDAAQVQCGRRATMAAKSAAHYLARYLPGTWWAQSMKLPGTCQVLVRYLLGTWQILAKQGGCCATAKLIGQQARLTKSWQVGNKISTWALTDGCCQKVLDWVAATAEHQWQLWCLSKQLKMISWLTDWSSDIAGWSAWMALSQVRAAVHREELWGSHAPHPW